MPFIDDYSTIGRALAAVQGPSTSFPTQLARPALGCEVHARGSAFRAFTRGGGFVRFLAIRLTGTKLAKSLELEGFFPQFLLFEHYSAGNRFSLARKNAQQSGS